MWFICRYSLYLNTPPKGRGFVSYQATVTNQFRSICHTVLFIKTCYRFSAMFLVQLYAHKVSKTHIYGTLCIYSTGQGDCCITCVYMYSAWTTRTLHTVSTQYSLSVHLTYMQIHQNCTHVNSRSGRDIVCKITHSHSTGTH